MAVPAQALERLARSALHVAGLGWPVFPVRPRAKIPAVTGWEDAATTDPGQIVEWWSARAWNIGLATGRAGLLVVDLDRGGTDPPPPEWAVPVTVPTSSPAWPTPRGSSCQSARTPF